MEVISKFSIFTGKQSRTTYRIVRTEDGMYRIEKFLQNTKEWTQPYRKVFTTEREPLSSVQFKNLFIPK